MYSETFNGSLLDKWTNGIQIQHRMWKITAGISDLNTEYNVRVYLYITVFVDSINFAINCQPTNQNWFNFLYEPNTSVRMENLQLELVVLPILVFSWKCGQGNLGVDLYITKYRLCIKWSFFHHTKKTEYSTHN